MKLTAMTYNIFSGRNLARELDLYHAAAVIRQVQPDFITLNEVRSHTEDVGPINQAYELGRLTGYFPVFGKAIDILGGEYGNAFLSRLPVEACEVIHIPDPERTSDHHYEHRCILRCELLAGERRITVLSTHFGLAPSEQENAVQTVLEVIRGESNPVLLMGDLNAEPDCPILKPLFLALRTPPKEAAFSPSPPMSRVSRSIIFCTATHFGRRMCTASTRRILITDH